MTVIPASARSFTDLPGRRSSDPLAERHAESSLRVVELETSHGRRAHRHPHSEEVVYVESGRGEVWLEGALHPVAQGDVVHIPAGSAHATIPAPGQSMRLICFFPHPDLANNLEDTEISVT